MKNDCSLHLVTLHQLNIELDNVSEHFAAKLQNRLSHIATAQNNKAEQLTDILIQLRTQKISCITSTCSSNGCYLR